MRASALPDVYFSNININQVLYISSKCQKYFQNIFQFSDGYFFIGFDGCDLCHFVEFSELKTGVSIINRRNVPSYRWNITPDVPPTLV